MSNEILLRLRKFHPADATIIAGWLKSEYQMHQWCADRYSRYPITANDINSHHNKYIDGHSSIALTMVDAEEVIGYITLRKPNPGKSEWRLGFVIVDDTKRGLGLGKKLVGMAIDYARKELNATKISLGVFENNPSAIHCYEAVGLKQVQREKPESYTCLGEIWNCIEMELII